MTFFNPHTSNLSQKMLTKKQPHGNVVVARLQVNDQIFRIAIASCNWYLPQNTLYNIAENFALELKYILREREKKT